MKNEFIKNEELQEIILNYLADDLLDIETLKLILDKYIILDFNWENVKLIIKGDTKQNENTSCKL